MMSFLFSTTKSIAFSSRSAQVFESAYCQECLCDSASSFRFATPELDSAIESSIDYELHHARARGEQSRRDMSNKQSSFHRLFQKAVKMKKRKPRQGTANLISTYLDESHLDEPFAIPKRGRNEGPSGDSDSGLFLG